MLVYLQIIDDMKIEVDPPNSAVILQLLQLARTFNPSSYDAAFLELAKRSQLPLATSDEAMRRAAEKFGVVLLKTPQLNPPHPS